MPVSEKPKKPTSPKVGCLAILAVFGLGIFAAAVTSNGNKNNAPAQSNATDSSNESSPTVQSDEAAPSAPSQPTCADDWKACKDNSDLANNSTHALSAAQVGCEEEVKRRNKYGDPKFCTGFLCEDFTKFRTGDDAPRTGILTLTDDQLQLQNGYGAWVHMTAVCTYDLKNETVQDLSIYDQN
ncbi:MAG: hypothetical protein WDN02_10320 [Methylovirgula sp.]|uniref:hypothetical protein n=1 Tax=Methylovirgula sp. TaxID=1978224 RepID=UPI0030760950